MLLACATLVNCGTGIFNESSDNHPNRVLEPDSTKQENTDEDQSVDIPVFKSLDLFTVTENDLYIGQINAEVNGETNVAYEIINNENNDLFEINSQTGDLSLTEKIDFESLAVNEHIYEITIRAVSGDKTATQVIKIELTNIDEAPTFNTLETVNLVENTNEIVRLSANDPENSIIEYSITGGEDAALFYINDSTQLLALNNLDYETSTDSNNDNHYQIEITAKDEYDNETQLALNIIVDDDDEPPVFVSSSIIEVTENNTEIMVLEARDPENSNIQFVISGGEDQNHFSIINDINLTFNNPQNFEQPSDTNTDNIYNLKISATDENDKSTEQSLSIHLTGINEAPSYIGETAVSWNENVQPSLTLNATDAENIPLNYSLNDDADSQLFKIIDDKLTFKQTPDFELPLDSDQNNIYEPTIITSDNVNTIITSFTITVLDEFESIPQFTTPIEFSIDENQTAVTKIKAIDEDGDDIHYTLGTGLDSSLFLINQTSGDLAFKNVPDFEKPMDDNKNNTYQILTLVSDGINEVEQVITINVNDLGPEIGNYKAITNVNKIYLAWDNISDAKQYDFYIAEQSGITMNNIMDLQGSKIFENIQSPYTITGLDNEKNYYLVFIAHNATEITVSEELIRQPFTPTIFINDSGRDTCGNDDIRNLACDYIGKDEIAGTIDDISLFPEQDAEYGRDALATTGVLEKIGDGHAGFDYTKLDSDGVAIADQTQTYLTNPWDCVKDNVTGLTWEVKTNDGSLRDMDHTYSWFDRNPKTNGNEPGLDNGGVCLDSNNCDTEKYVAQVNEIGLCGFNDWRLPNIVEFYTIMNWTIPHPGPQMDTDYFPNQTSNPFWSSSTNAVNPRAAWELVFLYGGDNAPNKTTTLNRVRLVRK